MKRSLLCMAAAVLLVFSMASSVEAQRMDHDTATVLRSALAAADGSLAARLAPEWANDCIRRMRRGSCTFSAFRVTTFVYLRRMTADSARVVFMFRPAGDPGEVLRTKAVDLLGVRGSWTVTAVRDHA